MNIVTIFRVGECYTNDQIRLSLQVGNLGGIRPSLDSNKNVRHVAILTATEDSGKMSSDNPYHDRIEGDILLYTGQGREGDQQLTGQNKRLTEQYTIPVPYYGFMNEGQQIYRFLGLLELSRHYQEVQVDRRVTLRKVWLFEFRIHKEPEVVPIDQARAISAMLLEVSRRQNPMSALEREVPSPVTTGNQPGVALFSAETETVRGALIQLAPYKFEHLIKALMEANGFSDVAVTPASADGGIDINAYVVETNDFFAGTHVQAQVKRWRHAVGSVEINNFRGALSSTAKGVFVTTSHYTRAAILEARHETKPSVTLIDGARLSSLVTRSRLNIDSFR
ncbi:MAG: restriction endonuclease [Chloroflexi bacterium]|nr:restriction endonuclease [Chloroflexota bacterium]